ncbi:MAG: hypothetical protein E7342_03265 [Clostridiales bacterium]|nr:hypothetical protein [Clostridiales bacterium]
MKKKLTVLFVVLTVLMTALFAISMTGFGASAAIQTNTITFESLQEGKITTAEKSLQDSILSTVKASSSTTGTLEVKKENNEKFVRITSSSDNASSFIALYGYFKDNVTVAKGTYKVSMLIRLGDANGGNFTLKDSKNVAFRFYAKAGNSTQPLQNLYEVATADANGFRKVEFEFTTTRTYKELWVYSYAKSGSYIDVKSISLESDAISIDTTTPPAPSIPDASEGETPVTIYYYNPLENPTKQPTIVVYKGIHNEENYRTTVTGVKGTENGKQCFKANLNEGLYCAKVSYGGRYVAKYFYIKDNTPVVLDIPYDPSYAKNWSEDMSIIQTDEFMEKLRAEDIVGYEPVDTPTFTKHANSQQEFMTNSELVEYVNNLDANSTNLKVYYPFNLSKLQNKTPVLVFAKNADNLPNDLKEAGAQIQALKKEVLMTTGGIHGNEPGGAEGNVAFAKELAGDYGNTVLDFFGAIVLIPSVEVDNFQLFVRNSPKEYTRKGTEALNSNRDAMLVELEATENRHYVYNAFNPTVCIDCHEDFSKYTLNPSTLITKDDQMNDIAIRHSSIGNSSFYDRNGDYYQSKDSIQSKIMMDSIDALNARGFRTTIYYSEGSTPAVANGYYTANGSLSFLIEVRRINSGRSHYERAVFGMREALKTITNQVMSYEGEIATKVFAGRERLASITKFDANNTFVLDAVSENFSYTVVNPTMHASGEWANEHGTRQLTVKNKITKTRAMATAYVIDATHPYLNEMLRILDIQNIAYTKIKAGSTLTLRKYLGGYKNTEIDTATDVTFENGAYVVTLNSAKAYLISYLFEPDVCNSTPYTTFAHAGYVTSTNTIYRSEVDDMHLVIKTMAEGYTPDTPNDDAEKGGCGSVIGTASVATGITLLAGAVMVFKKKD